MRFKIIFYSYLMDNEARHENHGVFRIAFTGFKEKSPPLFLTES